MTRRRRNNRVEAEGDEVFELWTEVPSSFLHPLHSDSRSKKKEREREGEEEEEDEVEGTSPIPCLEEIFRPVCREL